MSRVLRALGVVAVLSVICGLLAAGSAAAADPDPMAGAPATGACYDLTIRQAGMPSIGEAPVGCSSQHTMVVTAVGQLPAGLDWSTYDFTKPNSAFSAAYYKVCGPAAAKLVGSSRVRALSLYRDYWFAPTEADVAAGARWFSCLVALTEATRLLPLPASAHLQLATPLPARFARCVRDAKSGYQTIACSKRHQWRATFAQVIGTRNTPRNAARAARSTCPRHVSSPKNYLYATEGVSPRSFAIVCISRTRR